MMIAIIVKAWAGKPVLNAMEVVSWGAVCVMAVDCSMKLRFLRVARILNMTSSTPKISIKMHLKF